MSPSRGIDFMLYKGAVETSLKTTQHPCNFEGRSETIQDVTSHNIILCRVLAGIISMFLLNNSRQFTVIAS